MPSQTDPDNNESRLTSENLQTKSTLSKNHVQNQPSTDGNECRDCQWPLANENILMGPYNYIQQSPSKNIRRQLINALNVWLKAPPESISIINKVVEMLHAASLLVDDVEDNSVLRRGIPVAHSIYGIAQTINSANYVYFLALQEAQKLKNPAATNIYIQELLNLHRGQGMDLFWRDTLTCPTEEEYLEMVGNKTGGLFRLAVKLMQAESTTGTDCVSLINVMGLIYQICDDFLNLSDMTYTKNKGLCEDLTEGKFSFPIIHSIRSNPRNHQLISILKQKVKDKEVKLYAVSYMESTGSFAYTRKIVQDLHDKALLLINQIEVSGNEKYPEGQDDSMTMRDILNKITESTLRNEVGGNDR